MRVAENANTPAQTARLHLTSVHACSRPAYTLFEVLISIGLVSFLVAGLSSALHSYVLSHKQASLGIEQSSVLHGIIDDLRRDIRAIPDLVKPVSRLEASDTSESDQIGTEKHLEWDQDQYGELLPFTGTRHEICFRTHVLNGSIDSAAVAEDGVTAWPGVAWIWSSSDSRRLTVSIRDGVSSKQDFIASGDAVAAHRYRVSPARNVLTNSYDGIRQMEFRYWDGQSWLAQWDSMTKQSLPQAIEVVLTMQNNIQQSYRAVIAISPSPAAEGEVSRP